MWSANRPLSQSETELLRAQLNEVGPKELCCRQGARPLNTTHVWPRSTSPQPDGIGRESILRREENRNTRRKTLGVRLRSTETQPTYDPRPELNLGHRGGPGSTGYFLYWWNNDCNLWPATCDLQIRPAEFRNVITIFPQKITDLKATNLSSKELKKLSFDKLANILPWMPKGLLAHQRRGASK